MGETDFTLGTFAFAQEFCGLDFGDARLNRRFVKVIEGIYKNPGSIIQKTQGTWAEMMAAYRLFDNDKVEVNEILRAHREQTLARMALYERVLAIQDTTSICYSSHLSTEGIGSIAMGGFGKAGKGIFLHTTLATTINGTPLGILEQTMWSRGILKEGDELYESERIRWLKGIKASSIANFTEVICVGDREADGLDYFVTAQREDLMYVARAKEKLRKFEDEKGRSVADFMREQPIIGELSLIVRQKKKGTNRHRSRESRIAKLVVRLGEVRLLPSKISPTATDEERTVGAVYVEEVNPPEGVEAVCWLLFTNLPLENLEHAHEVLNIYKVRWEIETFHKILKSACKVEGAQLEHADRLKRLIVALSVVAWRLHVLTKEQRERPDAPCTEVLTELEWHTLYHLEKKTKKLPKKPPSLHEAVLWISKLGHFIGRKGDGEPGPLTLYEGWQKLMHCTEMYSVMRDVYNR
jgi:hypothetical protein